MESLRAGRTRYLVVVSRPVSKHAQQFAAPGVSPSRHADLVTSHLNQPINSINNNNNSSSSISLNPTSYFNDTTTNSGVSRFSANLTTCDNESLDADNTNECASVNDNQSETESNVGSSSSRGSSNEMEESCLLGIDCNEKTTVGLVLKVLADTAIRLDGDG